jgi:hypothetical protein
MRASSARNSRGTARSTELLAPEGPKNNATRSGAPTSEGQLEDPAAQPL